MRVACLFFCHLFIIMRKIYLLCRIKAQGGVITCFTRTCSLMLCLDSHGQTRWYICNSFYHHHQPRSINFIHPYSSVAVHLRLLYHDIPSVASCIERPISRENWVFASITTVQPMVCTNKGVHYGFEDHIWLFAHRNISLLSLYRLVWKHWTYEMSVRYILSSVCVK